MFLFMTRKKIKTVYISRFYYWFKSNMTFLPLPPFLLEAYLSTSPTIFFNITVCGTPFFRHTDCKKIECKC